VPDKHRRPARPNTDQPMTPSTERRPDMTAFHTTYEQLASQRRDTTNTAKATPKPSAPT